jgi:hypothetical protein
MLILGFICRFALFRKTIAAKMPEACYKKWRRGSMQERGSHGSYGRRGESILEERTIRRHKS